MHNSSQNKSLQNIMIVCLFIFGVMGVSLMLLDNNKTTRPLPYGGDRTTPQAQATEARIRLFVRVIQKIKYDTVTTQGRIDAIVMDNVETSAYTEVLAGFAKILDDQRILLMESKQTIAILLHQKYNIPFEFSNNTMNVGGDCHDLFEPSDLAIITVHETLIVSCNDGIFSKPQL